MILSSAMIPENDWFNYLKTQVVRGEPLLHDAYYDAQSRQVVTTDTLVEGTHFQLNWGTPEQLGQKALNVNLSDLAATCAKPQWFTISLGVPETMDFDWLQKLYTGLQKSVAKHSCQMIGGDTYKAPQLSITITAIGFVPLGFAVGRRNTAQVGDLIAISGTPGLASLGLQALQNNDKELYPLAVKQFLCPEPELALSHQVARLAEKHICLMDTSDGLADGLIKLAQASQKDLVVEANLLPNHPELQTAYNNHTETMIEKMLYGGEDYGLLYCLPPSLANVFKPLKIIGKVQTASSDTGNAFIFNHGLKMALEANRCYQHFEPSAPIQQTISYQQAINHSL